MPVVEVKLIEGGFTDEEKRRMIEDITTAMVNISGENLRKSTFVYIDDVKSGEWGIGGRCVTGEMVRGMRNSAPAPV